MASSGFQADVKALQKVLSARHLTYQNQHNKQISCRCSGPVAFKDIRMLLLPYMIQKQRDICTGSLPFDIPNCHLILR
ncbi:putative proteasome endopeptidase complex [Medicago truncatula]|uniref:Putative proteasome endopeptidase complex n=1 Tax=Medicago truncatula TaxID=3880 RepID=A0A396I383_MEDTR|nr:putative proteasome endopeptidase complex [Medicago truncatula]